MEERDCGMSQKMLLSNKLLDALNELGKITY